MKKIGLVYWPQGGNVEKIAQKIAAQFSDESLNMLPINKFDPRALNTFDLVIAGGSTVGADTWQDANQDNIWNTFFKALPDFEASNTKVALFGLGDQVLYPNHFVDELDTLKKEFKKHNALLIGTWPTKGYKFTESKAVSGDYFVGLALDEDHQEDLTDQRIEQWVTLLKANL